MLQAQLPGLQLLQLSPYAVNMFFGGPSGQIGLALGDSIAQARMLTIQFAFGILVGVQMLYQRAVRWIASNR